MPEITITVPGEVAERLTVLCDPTWECATIADVTEKLLDHAQQGVYRPGAWEREWLCQAFGYDWTARLVPDTRPETLSGDGRVIFDRPAGDGGGDGPPVPSRGAVMTAEILSDPAALGEIRAAEAEIARGERCAAVPLSGRCVRDMGGAGT